MQRYFVNNLNINKELGFVKITDQDFHHIKNVMRMKENDKIEVVSENGKVFLCEIFEFSDEYVQANIIEELKADVELNVFVTIALGMVRREKTEEVLRRVAELGASGFVSVKLSRSLIKPKNDEKKLIRMRTIAKEASEQSHRNKIMEVYPNLSFKNLLNFSKGYDLCLVAYEEAGRQNNFNLKGIIKNFKEKTILVLVGPEGGFTEQEIDILKNNKFKLIGLGPRILRVETAPLYIMAAISYEMELNNES